MHAECASRFSRSNPDDLSAESHDAYLHELAKPLGPPSSANPTERKSNMIVPIMARLARIPSDDPIFPEQIGDDWLAFAKRVPNRAAPGIDRLVAPGSRGSARTSATVMAPRSFGRPNNGQVRFCFARLMWSRCTRLPENCFSICR